MRIITVNAIKMSNIITVKETAALQNYLANANADCSTEIAHVTSDVEEAGDKADIDRLVFESFYKSESSDVILPMTNLYVPKRKNI